VSAPTHPLNILVNIGRLHIVAIATLGSFTFGWLFTGSYGWLLSGICALDWFLVNLLNRVVDLKEDTANAIVGTEFTARHKQAIQVLAFTLLFASFAVTHFWTPEITWLRVSFHTLGLAYNWPLRPGWRRIKELYFWKNTASATGFMITVFAYPLAAGGWAISDALLPSGITLATIVLTALWFMLFEISYEVIYDLRDAKGDRLAMVMTYPVVHGERGAVVIIDALIAAGLLVLIGGWISGFIPWRITIMGVASVMQVFFYKRWLKRGITSQDCINLTWMGTGLMVAYHLWILLQLPGVGLL
jgi:4-hydroxybenzoate polyprenyltransferase